MSLTATLASDESAVGKPLEITAIVHQVGTMTSNGHVRNQIVLVDVAAKDSKFDLWCSGDAAPPAGTKNGDKVVAKGTLEKEFGKPGLKDCTIKKAP